MRQVSIDEVFAACSALSQPDEVQIAYAKRVLEAIECSIRKGGADVMIEAETGVGKTIGYLIPAAIKAVEHGGRVVISTYTKALQRQVINDAARIADGVRGATGKTPTVARIVGKRGFFDIDRVHEIARARRNARAKPEIIEEWEDLIEWIEAPESSGEIQDYLDDNGRLPENVQPSMVCLDAASSEAAMARYIAHAEEARDADIIVTNHALLCLAAMHRTSILHRSEDERPVVAVIIDEADRLPDAARSIMTDQAPIVRVKRICEALSDHLSPSASEEMLRAVDALEKHLIAVSERYAIRGEAILIPDLRQDDLSSIKALATDFVALVDQHHDAINHADMSPDAHDMASDLLRYKNVITRSLNLRSDAGGEAETSSSAVVGVLHYSPVRNFPSISLTRLYPARIVRQFIDAVRTGELFGKRVVSEEFNTALILTSATLSVDGTSFGEMRAQFGIFDKGSDCSHLHGSFQVKRFGEIDEIIFADPCVHKPFVKSDDDDDEGCAISDEWIDYAADMIHKASEGGGYTLALCTSYRVAAGLVMKLVEKGFARDRIVQKLRAEHLSATIQRLRSQDSGVMITPTGWEGLDAASYGLSWSNVIICQIPLSRSDSAYKLTLLDYLVRKGKTQVEAETIIYGEIMSAALRKMRQGIGRGIRRKTDKFSLWIADPRIPPAGSVLQSDEPIPAKNKNNREMPMFLKALPQRFRKVPTRILLRDGRIIA